MSRSFADLDAAFSTRHGDEAADDVIRGNHVSFPTLEDTRVVYKDFAQTAKSVDLNVSRDIAHDPDSSSWLETPVHFREFCESTHHMDLMSGKPAAPSDQVDVGGALSERQYKDALAIVGENPKDMFDPAKRAYVFAALLWGKGCIDGDTELRDEVTGKIIKAKDLVAIYDKVKLKCYDEKTGRVVIKPIQDCFSKGTAKKLKFTLASGKSITVSPDHKFRTKEGWVRAGDLHVHNKIAVEKD